MAVGDAFGEEWVGVKAEGFVADGLGKGVEDGVKDDIAVGVGF